MRWFNAQIIIFSWNPAKLLSNFNLATAGPQEIFKQHLIKKEEQPSFSKRYSAYFGEVTTTVRPRGTRPWGTRPRGTRTSLVHDFKKGSKIFEISDFGTWTSWYTILFVCLYTILKSAQFFLWFYMIFLKFFCNFTRFFFIDYIDM